MYLPECLGLIDILLYGILDTYYLKLEGMERKDPIKLIVHVLGNYVTAMEVLLASPNGTVHDVDIKNQLQHRCACKRVEHSCVL